MTTPQFGNEEGCIFLGCYQTPEGRDYDLWYCAKDILGATIVARWSPHGPDYSSGMCFGWIEDQPGHPLVEARKRAQARNLDVQQELWEGKMVRHESGIYHLKDDARPPIIIREDEQPKEDDKKLLRSTDDRPTWVKHHQRWECTFRGYTLMIQRIRNCNYAYDCLVQQDGKYVHRFENSGGLKLANAKMELLAWVEHNRG